MDGTTIGARLRVLRRWRGMTLTELGGLSGLSPSFLSMAERGQRALDRRSHIAALASALRVSETDLVGGPHLTEDPVRSEPHTTIPGIRTALATNSLTAPAADRARPLAELLAEVARIDRSDYRIPEVGQMLPGVIGELHVHACAPDDEAAHGAALRGLIEVFQTATFASKDLGYTDLATVAAMKAGEAAGILGDPVSLGKAASLRIHTTPATAGRHKLAAAERAVRALEPHTDSALSVQVLGMLTLATAMSATDVHDAGAAGDWLDYATDLARRVPDSPTDNWGAFSATNVAVWRIALAVERGESGGKVLEMARPVDERRFGTRKGRHSAFLADVGRGLARDPRTRDAALDWLRRAETIAPHKIRNNVRVHEAVAVMLQQARTRGTGRELRGMAARMGIPH